MENKKIDQDNFFDQLLEVVPEFKNLFEEHVEYNEGDILSTLCLGDLARFFREKYDVYLQNKIESQQSLELCQRIATFLEHSLLNDDPILIEWVYSGFLEMIPDIGGKLPDGILKLFGEKLRSNLESYTKGGY